MAINIFFIGAANSFCSKLAGGTRVKALLLLHISLFSLRLLVVTIETKELQKLDFHARNRAACTLHKEPFAVHLYALFFALVLENKRSRDNNK